MARVKAFGLAKKFNKIPRENDNTSDIEKADLALHARNSRHPAPIGAKSYPATSPFRAPPMP